VVEVGRLARRLRRRLRAAALRGTIWKPLAIVEGALLLGVLGLGAGLLLHVRLAELTPPSPAPLAQTGGVGAAGRLPASEAPAPRSTPAAGKPSPAQSAVVEMAVAEATTRTGISFTASGCAAGASCLSHASETDGQGAAYVTLLAQGYGVGNRCYVYLDNPSGTWQVAAVACGSGDAFAPAVNSVVTVHAPSTCGRVRKTASLSAQVVRCVSNGSRVTVTGAPALADGEMWWPVSDTITSGYIAEEILIDSAALVPAKS
jgi:hypothetical protein